MKGLLIILVFFMMIGGASAATVELSISGLEPDGTAALVIAYTGAVNSIIWINGTDGFSVPTDPLNGNDYVYEVMVISCNIVFTAEMYTGGSLVATDSIQRTDAGCNQPEVSFSQSVYSCDSTIQVNYQYGQNSTIRLHDLSDYGNVLWSAANVNGSGALYPDYNFTPGFSYLVEIQTADGTSITFSTMDVQLCGTGTDPDDPGGGTGTGDGGGDGGTGTGTDDGGSGSDGGTDPFTVPNSYDPTNPGDEWKTWIDLNGDRVTSYAETMAAFRFGAYTFLSGAYLLALFKFGLGFRL